MKKINTLKVLVILLCISIILTACEKKPELSDTTILEAMTASIGTEPVVLGSLDRDSIEISIPKGVLDRESIFSLKIADNSPQNDSLIGSLLGTPVEIDIEDDIKRFDEPIEVLFKLTQEQWDSFENADDIYIGYYDGYSWVYLEPIDANSEKRTVLFKTYHCSYIFPSYLEKEEINKKVARSLAIESTMIDKNAEIRKTTESMVKSVMGDAVDKSLLRDIVEGIMDQNDFTQFGKSVVNMDAKEAEEKFISVYTQVVASNLFAYASNADNLGDLGSNLSLVGSYGKSAAHFQNGEYKKAAEELARGIISTHPIGKLFTTAVNVTERQVARWKNEEIEAAYQIYLKGKEPKIAFWGYGSIEAGDFNEIWDQMRGVGRQIIIEAVSDFKKENGREPTSEERIKLELDAKTTLESEFESRKEKEATIAETEKKNLEFLAIMEEGNLLESNRYGYDTDKISYKERVKQIFDLRNKVLDDTKRKMNLRGEDSKTELNVYTVEKLIAEYLSSGEESYKEMLIELGLVEDVKTGTFSGSYSVPLNFSQTTFYRNEVLEGGKVLIAAKASIEPSDATIEISKDGTMSIMYSVNINCIQENTVEYNPELTVIEIDTGNYTVRESFTGIQIHTTEGSATNLADILGERTTSGHVDLSRNRSWEVESDGLNAELKNLTVKQIGKELIISGKAVIRMPDNNLFGIFEAFSATFDITIAMSEE
ncbi:MAG: hypothetical protein GXZ08_07900 [Tissierellia bacterium]|nr:hypothetical protein [Tissierellia bacterium]